MSPSRGEPEAVSWGVVIVAAGGGTRFGGQVPKQFLPLDGATVVDHCIEAALSLSRVLRVVLVLPPDDGWRRYWSPPEHDRLELAAGGELRSQSVLAGLRRLRGIASHVAVHDAARPLAGAELYRRVMDAAEKAGAAVPLYPVSSTVKSVCQGAGRVERTLDRSRLRLSQTPQAARLDALMRALKNHPESTDESCALELDGIEVAGVKGQRSNIKITRPGDLRLLGAFMPRLETAAGTGLDFHPLKPGRPMVICGVRFDEPVGPAGHSDGDVGLHAVADAVLAAARMGDIGELFPPSDPELKGVDSRRLLAEVVSLVRAEGWRVASADVTIMGSIPRVSPSRRGMISSLARVLECSSSSVWVKGTTTNGLGAIGRGEGIGAMALVHLRRTPDSGERSS